jgi:hypothetical protein
MNFEALKAAVIVLLIAYVSTIGCAFAIGIQVASCQPVCDADSPGAALLVGGGYRCYGANECPVQ